MGGGGNIATYVVALSRCLITTPLGKKRLMGREGSDVGCLDLRIAGSLS